MNRLAAQNQMENTGKLLRPEGRQRTAAQQQGLRQAPPEFSGDRKGAVRKRYHRIDPHNPRPYRFNLGKHISALPERTIDDRDVQIFLAQQGRQLGNSQWMKEHGLGGVRVKVGENKNNVGHVRPLNIFPARNSWFCLRTEE